MTTVRAASNAMPSVASVPRKAAEVLHREEEVQEVAAREAVLQEVLHREVLHRETQAVAAVAPAVMTTTITIHRAAVAEAEGDSFLCHKTLKTFKTIVVGISNGSQPLAVASPD